MSDEIIKSVCEGLIRLRFNRDLVGSVQWENGMITG